MNDLTLAGVVLVPKTLRFDSAARDGVARAVAAFPQSEKIFENNMRTLRRLGPDGWAALRLQCKSDARG